MASAFDHGHKDLVLAVDYNLYGTRMATASSDHTIRVWDKQGDAWELMDSWKAHDAEVTDVSPSAAHEFLSWALYLSLSSSLLIALYIRQWFPIVHKPEF